MGNKFQNMKWIEWAGSDDEWDTLVEQFQHWNIYQTSKWATYKRKLGWLSLKMVLFDGIKVIATAQIFYKKFFNFICIGWIPGGVLGDLRFFNAIFLSEIKYILKLKILYLRSYIMQPYDLGSKNILLNAGWNCCRVKLLSGSSMIYKPNLNELSRIKITSNNWRHNLKRSTKRQLLSYKWIHPDPKLISSIYREMEGIKKIKKQNSEIELSTLIEVFKDSFMVFRCDDSKEEPLAIRACLIHKDRAWDMLAATSLLGRKVYSSYSAFWSLMNECSVLNISRYDLSGIDRKNNEGVYNFKKGTGAVEIAYLGEFELSSINLFSYIVSALILMMNII